MLSLLLLLCAVSGALAAAARPRASLRDARLVQFDEWHAPAAERASKTPIVVWHGLGAQQRLCVQVAETCGSQRTRRR